MPWRKTCPMEEKFQFVLDYDSGDYTMAQLCRKYGIARPTGYKWAGRYDKDGIDGLKDQSRAPSNNPSAIGSDLKDSIVEVRAKHRSWGGKKILAWLERNRPGLDLCAVSTANDLLRRLGLSVPRKRRTKSPRSADGLVCGELQPNDVWCADFKGWFLCGDGSKCTPLTITDQATRFVLKLQALDGRTDSSVVIPLFDAAFEEFGLPRFIRTDNGPPFASTGLGGLTRLSVHWIELGISPERIRPGNPQENGRHERMHKTLKAETASPARRTLALQQQCFDQWREEFNFERPHEALGQKSPADMYCRSELVMPEFIKPWHYDDSFDETRRVRGAGQFKWKGRDVLATSALTGRDVGMKRITDRYWEIYFRHIFLGLFDAKHLVILRPGKSMDRILANLTKGGGGLASGCATLHPSPAPPPPLVACQPEHPECA